MNDNNKNIKIESTSFDLVPGSYTFTELGNHLQTQINASALSECVQAPSDITIA